MGNAIITISDDKDGVGFQVEFDPELTKDSPVSPAQAVAFELLLKVKSEGLEKALAPFVEPAEETPQPKENQDAE